MRRRPASDPSSAACMAAGGPMTAGSRSMPGRQRVSSPRRSLAADTGAAYRHQRLDRAAAGPAGRRRGSCTHRPAGDRDRRIGGGSPSGGFLDDTWLIGTTAWPSRLPDRRGSGGPLGAELIADPARGRLLLFGGRDAQTRDARPVGAALPAPDAYSRRRWTTARMPIGSPFGSSRSANSSPRAWIRRRSSARSDLRSRTPSRRVLIAESARLQDLQHARPPWPRRCVRARRHAHLP